MKIATSYVHANLGTGKVETIEVEMVVKLRKSTEIGTRYFVERDGHKLGWVERRGSGWIAFATVEAYHSKDAELTDLLDGHPNHRPGNGKGFGFGELVAHDETRGYAIEELVTELHRRKAEVTR